MRQDTAVIIVQSYALVSWITALFLLLAATGIYILVPQLHGPFITTTRLSGGLLLLTAAATIIGLGLWQYKEWARVALIICACTALVLVPIGTVLGGMTLWLFGFHNDIRNAFSSQALIRTHRYYD